LDNKVLKNFSNTSLKLLFPAILLLIVIVVIFIVNNGLTVDSYIEIQKDLFIYLNSVLAKLPILQFNLTQLGNPLIFLGLLTPFIICTPKLWEVILTSTIISALMSFILKIIFDIPRPAQILDHESFIIIGEVLGGYKSMPSGHSITTFSIITILLIAFMPKKINHKIIWSFSIILIGLIIALSRVGVGAHYPLDVLIGSTIGYMSSIFGIYLNNKFNIWFWIKKEKYYPILMLFLIIWGIAIINEITLNNLLIFYFSLASLVTTVYLILRVYVKK
jgi:membrane-associated phospholipid phosphatase